MPVTAAAPGDAPHWERMRNELWPAPAGEHATVVAAFFAGVRENPAEVLVAREDGTGEIVGFVELSIRPFAEGCTSNRVAYLEGWFVVRARRGEGAGRALIRAAEAWGRAQGCAEFASDAAIDNASSHAAHRALGFEEVGRVVCFRKAL